MSKVVWNGDEDECWTWEGSKKKSDGYGLFWDRGRGGHAHRFAYELLICPIPVGFELDHLCRNRACVNPAHLEPVTHAENMARGAHALKTHCPQGHLYSGDNLYVVPSTGKRQCRACHRLRKQKKRKR